MNTYSRNALFGRLPSCLSTPLSRWAAAIARMPQAKPAAIQVERLEDRQLLSVVALFYNSGYVDTTSATPSATAVNLRDELMRQGETVTTFTGIDATSVQQALAGADVLVLPALAKGDLVATMTNTAKDRIRSFVSAGGGVVIAGDPQSRNTSFLEDVFGLTDYRSDVLPAGVSQYKLNATDSAGTAFAGGPAALPFQGNFYRTGGTGLAAGSRYLYQIDNGNADPDNLPTVVIASPYAGRLPIVFLGWDWTNGGPNGALDGNWNAVLGRAIDQAASPASIPPVAPSNVIATAVSASRIDVTWTDNASNESGFKIERGTIVGGVVQWTQVGTTAANTLSFAATGLAPGTSYVFRVRASNSFGDSPYSAASATVSTPNPTSTPTAPSSLTSGTVTASSIVLSWSDNATNETGFIIERATSASGPWVQVGTTAVGVTSFIDNGLTAGTSYFYRVAAVNQLGTSIFTATLQMTTPGQNPNVPTAPTSLAATTASATSITLAWINTSTTATGFLIERATSAGGPFTQIGTTTAGVANFTASGLTTGLNYYFRVRGIGNTGPGAYSAAVQWTAGSADGLPAPAGPVNVRTIAVSATTILLSWDGVAGNATGFGVQRADQAGGPWTTVATTTGVTSVTVEGLNAATTYYFRVFTLSGFATGSASAAITAATAAAPDGPDVNRFVLSATVVGTLPDEVIGGEGGVLSIIARNDGKRAGTGPFRITIAAVRDDGLATHETVLFIVTKSLALKAGGAKRVKVRFDYPADLDGGSYRLVARIESAGQTVGSSPTPDITSASAMTASLIRIARPIVDLALSDLTPAKLMYDQSAPAKATLLVRNLGSTTFNGTVPIRLAASDDQVADDADTLIVDITRRLRIKPGQSKRVNIRFVVPPTLAGTFHLTSRITPAITADADAVNDVAVGSIPITIGG